MTKKKTQTSDTEQVAAEAIETLETVMKLGAEAATEGYKGAAAHGQDQIDMAKVGYHKAVSYGKNNLDVLSEASALAIAGVEACFGEMADWTGTAMAENLDLMQRMFAVKSPQEFFNVQVEAANKSAKRMIGQTTKISQIATESMTKAYTPIKAHMDEVMETFTATSAT